MSERVTRMLAEDDPDLPFWDHEAAVADEHVNEQDPVAVAGDLGANAVWLAGVLDLVEGDEWDRPGTKDDGSRLTVAIVARATLHELAHHRWDAETRLA
jgi:hypothetical protein